MSSPEMKENPSGDSAHGENGASSAKSEEAGKDESSETPVEESAGAGQKNETADNQRGKEDSGQSEDTQSPCEVSKTPDLHGSSDDRTVPDKKLDASSDSNQGQKGIASTVDSSESPSEGLKVDAEVPLRNPGEKPVASGETSNLSGNLADDKRDEPENDASDRSSGVSDSAGDNAKSKEPVTLKDSLGSKDEPHSPPPVEEDKPTEEAKELCSDVTQDKTDEATSHENEQEAEPTSEGTFVEKGRGQKGQDALPAESGSSVTLDNKEAEEASKSRKSGEATDGRVEGESLEVLPSAEAVWSDKSLADGEKFAKFRQLIVAGQVSNKEVVNCVLNLVRETLEHQQAPLRCNLTLLSSFELHGMC